MSCSVCRRVGNLVRVRMRPERTLKALKRCVENGWVTAMRVERSLAAFPVRRPDLENWRTLIVTRLRELVPGTIAVHGGGLDPHGEALYQEELALVARAVPKRRREFRAGRIYARRALREIGAADAPLLLGPLRAPIWPLGTTGSITHTRNICAAVAGLTGNVAAIGIDIEDFATAQSDLLHLVGVPSEVAQRREVEDVYRTPLAHLLFAIKEATYKAYAPLAGVILDYQNVAVTIHTRSSRFCAKLIASDKPRLLGHDSIEGQFAVAQGHVLAVAHVLHPAGYPQC